MTPSDDRSVLIRTVFGSSFDANGLMFASPLESRAFLITIDAGLKSTLRHYQKDNVIFQAVQFASNATSLNLASQIVCGAQSVAGSRPLDLIRAVQFADLMFLNPVEHQVTSVPYRLHYEMCSLSSATYF